MIKLLALTAMTSTVAVTSVGTGWVQYGALGLCAVMVIFLINLIKAQAEVIKEKDKKLMSLLEAHLKATNRLAEALEDRPCLESDSRVKKKG